MAEQRCEDCGGRFDRPGLFACDTGHVQPDLAQRIVARIEADLCDRRGLRQAFEGVDEDIQDEIRDNWAAIIRTSLLAAVGGE